MTNEYFKIVDNAIKYHEDRGHILVVEVLKGVKTRMRQVAMDKMAENARELGLTYDLAVPGTERSVPTPANINVLTGSKAYLGTPPFEEDLK